MSGQGSQLVTRFGDTFPSELYSCLESVLGVAKAATVLTSVASRLKTIRYDPNSVMYGNCQPRHRKKMWTTIQVMMEISQSQSMTVALQCKESLQPILDSWLKGAKSATTTAGSSIGSSTETDRLNIALNTVFAATMDAIKDHPDAHEIMKAFKTLMLANKIDDRSPPFSTTPPRMHNMLRSIILTLQALVGLVGEEEATTIKWQIREDSVGKIKGDEMVMIDKCLDMVGIPQLPETPTDGIFDIFYDPRIFDPLQHYFSPAKAKYILDCATKRYETIVFDMKDTDCAIAYPHRRKDFLKVNQVMLKVATLGKPMDKGSQCTSYLQNFLTEYYVIPGSIMKMKTTTERSTLSPAFKRLTEVFAEKSESIVMCRNIWEELDEDLLRVPFQMGDARWSKLPRAVRHDMYYIDMAIKAVKKWAGKDSAEHLQYQIKQQLLEETKGNKKESKLIAQCLEITGFNKATSRATDKPVPSKTDSKRKAFSEEERKKKMDALFFDTHTFMIGVHLALLYDMKKEVRQAIVQKLNRKLRNDLYDPNSPAVTVVPEIARPQVWLSGLILASVREVAGSKCEGEMELEVRRHLSHFQSTLSLRA